MPTPAECVCCKEVDAVLSKMLDNPDTPCITEHPGFQPVCLDLWVLQTAYRAYREHYGHDSRPIHELVINNLIMRFYNIMFKYSFLHCRRFRFTAYRQLVGWCWGWVGKNVRVILPSCAVLKIRNEFPSEHYTGFKYPSTT